NICVKHDGGNFGLPLYVPEPQKKMIAEVKTFVDNCIAQMAINTDREIMAMDAHETVVRLAGNEQPAVYRGIVGDNSLVLNTESMMQAVAYWLNKEVFKTPVIVSGIHFDRQSEDYTVEFLPKPAVED
ncbi:MAG: hypothetical protein ACTS5I_00040, partial [Rhodanobacter sp.]